MTTKLSAKEAAKEIGTDARTLRKFIRSAKDLPVEPVGQGARYEFTPKEVKALKKAFVSWSNGSTPKQTKKVNGHKIDTADPEDGVQDEIDRTTEEVDLDDDGEVVDLEDLDGPSDDELLDIEDIELD